MKHFAQLFLTALLFITAPALLADTPQSPRDVIESAVTRMTQAINEHREALKTNPGLASELVSDELEKLVAFKRITRLVMGKWFAQASNEQRNRFLDAFKQSLIDTYSSGITLYEGQNIEVLPLRDTDVRGDRANVRMQIATNSGKDVPISYTMIKQDNTWLVENVIVNGLNLGKTFRTQFEQSADNYGGDLDQVIEHWIEQIKTNDTLEDTTNVTQ